MFSESTMYITVRKAVSHNQHVHQSYLKYVFAKELVADG